MYMLYVEKIPDLALGKNELEKSSTVPIATFTGRLERCVYKLDTFFVCRRVKPMMAEMNQSENLLVVAHQAVIRCILAFLTNSEIDKIPKTVVPLHTLLKITFRNGKNNVEYIHFEVPTYEDEVKKVPKVLTPKNKASSGESSTKTVQKSGESEKAAPDSGDSPSKKQKIGQLTIPEKQKYLISA